MLGFRFIGSRGSIRTRHLADSDDGALLPVTGGDPLGIKTPIAFCARSDLSGPRYYDGRIANLGIWDDLLTDPQIAALFEQVHARIDLYLSLALSSYLENRFMCAVVSLNAGVIIDGALWMTESRCSNI